MQLASNTLMASLVLFLLKNMKQAALPLMSIVHSEQFLENFEPFKGSIETVTFTKENLTQSV
jgi:hypothetical protein